MSEGMEIVPLVDGVHGRRALSPQARALLKEKRTQERILAAAGIPAEDIKLIDPYFLTFLIDDSGSMHSNAEAVRMGHNTILDALSNRKAGHNPDRIFVSTQLLNGGVIDPYTHLARARRLDRLNYNPRGDTPLYNRMKDTLGAVIAKTLEATEEYKRPTSATLIMSDGGNNISGTSEEELRDLISGMISSELHIIAAWGVKGSQAINFKDIFRNVGIEEKWILTSGSTPEDILRVLGLFTKVVQQSAVPGNFKLLMAGGWNEVK